MTQDLYPVYKNVRDIEDARREFQKLSVNLGKIDDRLGKTQSAAPTVNDDVTAGWEVGSTWPFNSVLYILTANGKGVANWQQVVSTRDGSDGGVANAPALDGANDYVGVFDVSASPKVHVQVTLDELVTAGGGDTYTPADASDWEDTDPTTKTGALDRVADGRAGVALIAATAPTTPATGQVWLDTSATGAPGLGVLGIKTITADTTLTSSDTVVLCDASAGAITVTLPAAASHAGRHYYVKKIDSSANMVTIDGNADETIDGGLTAVLTVENEDVPVVCDGANWNIL